MLKKLWKDEGGATISAELALVATILVIGVVVGLTSVQNAVVGELADVAAAIGSLEQSYSTATYVGHAGGSTGTLFTDTADHCDGSATGFSACVSISAGVAE